GGTGGAATAAPAARLRRHRRRDYGGTGGATTAVPAARNTTNCDIRRDILSFTLVYTLRIESVCKRQPRRRHRRRGGFKGQYRTSLGTFEQPRFTRFIVVEVCQMTLLTTDTNLIDRLNAAASRGVSAAERRMQRVSFVYSGMSRNSSMTKHQVAEALDRMDAAEGRN
ncbi:hypothetical protein, partial [Sphingomonas sp. UMB7805-LC452B]